MNNKCIKFQKQLLTMSVVTSTDCIFLEAINSYCAYLHELTILHKAAHDKWVDFMHPDILAPLPDDLYQLYCRRLTFYQDCIAIRLGPGTNVHALRLYIADLNELEQLFAEKQRLFDNLVAAKVRIQEMTRRQSNVISHIVSFLY
jgi:hypothetical protein